MENNHAASGAEQFEFRGRTREYFGIWIVNLLLSIVTLGIYSAWAKVRTKRYFYQNTYVGGRNFDYHATGKQILTGRIIFFVGLVIYSALLRIPVVGFLFAFGILLLMPYLIVKSLRFNASVSSWSNVRFRFHGKTKKAFLCFLVYPLLGVLSLFIAMPFANRETSRFIIGNHALGQSRFQFDSGIGPFYKAFLMAIGWVVIVLGIGVLTLYLTFFQDLVLGRAAVPSTPTIVIAIYAIAFMAILPAAAIYQAMIRNHVFYNTKLDDIHRFRSTVVPMKLFSLAITNALAIVFSLGLMLPWARIRMTRYLVENTALIPGGSLDAIVDQLQHQEDAFGDAYTDMEGVDIGLPL